MHKKISTRRLLTFALAGIIALESPITAYAANQDEAAWVDASQEGDSSTAATDTANNEDDQIEDASNNEDDRIEDASNNEDDRIEDASNNEDDRIEDASNNEDDQTEDTLNNESGKTEDASNNEGGKTEDTSNNEGGKTEDTPGNEDSQTEDIINYEDNRSEDGHGSSSDENLEAEELDSLQSFDEIIEIDYNTALNEGVTVTAPYGEKNKSYYSMLIPEDGQYAFYSDEKVGSGYTRMALRIDASKANDASPDRYQYFRNPQCLVMPTGYMKKGEIIYFEMYNSNAEETYNMRVANQTKLNKTTENNYSYILSEGISIDINATAGYRHIKYGAAINADPEKVNGLSGSYDLDYYFDYENKWDTENRYFTLSSSNNYTNNKVLSFEMENTCNNYYVLTNDSGHFIALLVCEGTLTTGSTDEKIYIHNTVFEENRITLDIELIETDNMICYYAPADGSEEEKSCRIYDWNNVEFSDLRPGTKYIFKFYNSEERSLLYDTKEYSTIGESISVDVKDYSAEFNDSFTDIDIGATVGKFNGKTTWVELNYEYTDSMGVKRSGYDSFKISPDKETQLKRLIKLSGASILAGYEGDVRMWLYFPKDGIKTNAVTVHVEAAKEAYFDESDIKFDVLQGEASDAGKYTAKYEVTLPINCGDMKTQLYYRPSGSAGPYVQREISGSTQGNFYSGAINGLDKCSEYEFVLCVGGLKLVRTLPLANVSGLMLERVEASTDHTGPYDIIRTYKINTVSDSVKPQGDYYLHLKYLKEGEEEYKSLGYVQLNPDNNYQETVSSAALDNVWFQQDTDYSLMWILSSSENPGSSNTESILYENIHTETSKIRLTQVETFCNYQIYTVALDEEDTANFKANKRNLKICGYLKASDGSHHLTKYGTYNLTFDNKYTQTFKLTSLIQSTSYELHLIDDVHNVEFAADSFITTEDKRKITVTSEVPAACSAQINYSVSGFSISDSGYISCYIRKKGYGEWSERTETAISNKDMTASLYDLDAETVYEYKIGYKTMRTSDIIYLQKVWTGTFTTKTDERKITVTSKQANINTADIGYDLSGIDEDEIGTIKIFIRKKSDKKGRLWEYKKSNRYTAPECSGSYKLSGLDEDTVYEYRIGFSGETLYVSDLKDYVDGEFKTCKGERKVEIKSVKTKTLSAVIECTISGMEEDAYLLCYVCNVDDLEWKKVGAVEVNVSDSASDVSFTIASLKEQTVYRYKLGFGSSNNTGVNDLEQAVENVFTTQKDTRALSEAKAEVYENEVVLSALFTGNTDHLPSYVYFFYKESNAAGYKKSDRVVNTTNAESQECSASITDLTAGEEYEFVIIISDSAAFKGSPDDVEKDEFKVMGKFTTNDAKPPSEIILPQTELYLNANTVYKGEHGYGYQILKPEFTPETASKDLICKSSDVSIVTVQTMPGSKSISISAVAEGKATITVASKYDPEVTAECEVVVGNYQLGYEVGDGSIRLIDNKEMSMEKGMLYSGYKLCKIDGSANPSALTADKFSVHSNNETIVSWADGAITANGVGDTRLVFTADDKVPAYLDIHVSAKAEKHFTIVGFTTNNSQYPAKREEETDEEGNTVYTIAYTPGITYTAVCESIPSSIKFSNSDYDWYTSDELVASVDDKGMVTPHKAGTVFLEATPKPAPDGKDIGILYIGEPACRVVLQIKDLPTAELADATPVYALADISSKIGDVKFPDDEAWKGWQWKDKDTPLIINGVNKAYYPFDAVYTGDEYYAQEASINVYIAKVTGVSVSESGDNYHNKVVEVANLAAGGKPAKGSDAITLTVESLYNGSLKYNEKTNYFYDVDIAPVNGLIIEKGEFKADDSKLFRTFTIMASKKGNYTLKPVIKVKDKNNSNEKILAKTSYKIKAVDSAQAYIELKPVVTEGMSFNSTEGKITINDDSNVKSFKIQAQVTDRNGKSKDEFDSLKIAWSSTDKKVVSVKADRDTHTATVNVSGEGHAIITAKAKDAAGHSAALQIEIRNYVPRVDVSKVSVNLAYDYKTADGRSLAINSLGAVEVVPAYKDTIQSVKIYSADKKSLSPDFSVYKESDSYKYIICDTDSTKTGAYDCSLCVKTLNRSEPYYYPLRITVVNKPAKVTAKSNRTVNLFYRSEPASIDISVSGAYMGISKITWTGGQAKGVSGFSSVSYAYSYDTSRLPKNVVGRYYFAQGNIKLDDDNKLADNGIVSGFVDVKLSGYKESNEGIEVRIKWNYKKPTVITKDAVNTLVPSVTGKNSASFVLYNKTDGKNISFTNDSYGNSDPKYYYNELVCDNADVRFTKTNEQVDYTYSSSKTRNSEKIRLTLKGDDWREALTAVHTIKTVIASPVLSASNLTINTTKIGTVHTDVILKGVYSAKLDCEDIAIEGKNAKAKALLDTGMLEISRDKDKKYRINVRLNRDETTNQTAIANGTCSYKVTPYYTDAAGNRIEAKSLLLKIKVTNKEITARTKVKGSLDLAKGENSYNNNYIELSSIFNNIGKNLTILNSELTGEYSKYFNLYDTKTSTHRLTIAQDGKLKAGYKYKLSIRYTIQIGDGETFIVKGKTFTVKPKQSKPKIKVANNNQTLYTAVDSLTRDYNLSISDRQYGILSVEGSLDCNKDGKADIVVEYTGYGIANSIKAKVRITDPDGVITKTGAKGKTYNIPVTVKLKGRDGISKDVKTSIKVTVKR